MWHLAASKDTDVTAWLSLYIKPTGSPLATIVSFIAVVQDIMISNAPSSSLWGKEEGGGGEGGMCDIPKDGCERLDHFPSSYYFLKINNHCFIFLFQCPLIKTPQQVGQESVYLSLYYYIMINFSFRLLYMIKAFGFFCNRALETVWATQAIRGGSSKLEVCSQQCRLLSQLYPQKAASGHQTGCQSLACSSTLAE